MQTKQDNNRKIAFLIVSCDKYSDLWVPFFTLLDKYWPEIYYKKYLLSNSKEFSWPGVNQINIGEDISYSDNLLKCIDHIDEDWILLWLEDLFLSSPVNTTKLDRIISVFTKNESVDSINVNLEKMLITINLKKGKNLNDDIIRQLIKDSGYDVTEINRDS